MGLGGNVLREIIALRQAGALPERGRVVEIGAQQLSNDFLRSTAELDAVAAAFGLPALPPFGSPSQERHSGIGLEPQAADAPASRPFWQALGFRYATIDFGGHRDAFPLDLNRERVPRTWRCRFDIVLNAGTTEHVANQDNAFNVMHDLVRPGGVMLHELPSAGMPTHGLFNYTLKFFWHLCRDNNYEVLRLETLPGGMAPPPGDIIISNTQWGRGAPAQRLDSEPLRDWVVLASLRKTADAPYVTPLDMPLEAMPRRDLNRRERIRQWAALQWRRTRRP